MVLSANFEFWKLQLPKGHWLLGSFSFPSSWPFGLLLRGQLDWVSLIGESFYSGLRGLKTCSHSRSVWGLSRLNPRLIHISPLSFLFPTETPPISALTLYSPTIILLFHSRRPWNPTVSSLVRSPQPHPEPTASPLWNVAFFVLHTFYVLHSYPQFPGFHTSARRVTIPSFTIHGSAQDWKSTHNTKWRWQLLSPS